MTPRNRQLILSKISNSVFWIIAFWFAVVLYQPPFPSPQQFIFATLDTTVFDSETADKSEEEEEDLEQESHRMIG